jgi:hypothetical protein
MPPKKQPKPKPAKQTGRATVHIFDRTFARLLQLSNPAIISLVNGLFRIKGAPHPLDSAVDHLKTESVNEEMRRRTGDTFLLINGVTYHIEVQTTFDADMMIRIFEYGFLQGVRGKTFENGVRTIVLPQSRIIYLTVPGKTPAKQTLRLKFPDGFFYDYEVKTFNPLDHSVEELEKRGMALLLPFYVMKMREQVAKADSAGREKLSTKMKSLLDKIDEAVKNCRERGQIDDQDALDIIRDLDRLYTELYGGYKEFAEDTSMKERIVRYSTQIMEVAEKKGKLEGKLEVAKNLLVIGDSPEKVAKAAGLPLRQIKALLKTLKVEQPA